MSKRQPTREERIRQSITNRQKLIDRLEIVLANSEGQDPARVRRLEERIADLKRRQADPAGFLKRGFQLKFGYHDNGDHISSLAW